MSDMDMLRHKIADRDWAKIIAVAASVLLVALLVAYIAQGQRLDAANARISAGYQKAFYETCELMEGMASNLRKLLVASGAKEQALLGEVARQAEGAQSNLSELPLGEAVVASSIKFVNQAGDFSSSLMSRLAAGGAVSESDYQTLAQLSISAGEYSSSLNDLLTRYESGETVFTASDFETTGDEDLYPLTNPSSEFPVLLYDGPFSDGRASGEFLALEGLRDVTAEEAAQLLRAYIGVDEVVSIRLDGESMVPVECYEFTLEAHGYQMDASVTKRGGEVLYMLTANDITEINIAETEAVEVARQFLRVRGYGDMEMSYYSRYDGIMTINFAAVQNGVILYPDLIKVQVSLREGAVVGVEAAHYLSNHTVRTIEMPALSEEEAVAILSSQLTMQQVRLCIIPENSGEYLCYEITAAHGGDTFLIYIDANSGVERSIMQLISDENGALVM